LRYFVEAAFDGTRYAGWQRQPGDLTVQQVLEEAFTLILRENVSITGCGRTDAGVHARQYFFHFDTEQEFSAQLLKRFNRYLPPDIALLGYWPVELTNHARYDAMRRTYRYYIRFSKDPHEAAYSLWYPYPEFPDFDIMAEMASLLLRYDAFKPFCKEGSDARHYRCELLEASWRHDAREAVFTISANRFLRGMVRLIVGTALQMGRGKITLETVEAALTEQSALKGIDSAPAHGLHLEQIGYPFLLTPGASP
jgi:tRNA pseudouridine38-40 synthase